MRLAVEVAETKNLFETLANKSLVGIHIIQDGKFCYTNPTFQHNTGYKEDELLGRDSLELVVPEDREKVRENAIKMLKGELTLPYQFRVTHKNGSIKWVIESVVSIQYRGRRATLGDFIDITERKQVEEALRASEETYKTVVEDAPIGIYYSDFNGTFLYGNKRAEEIIGYKVEELLGKSFLKLKLLRPEGIAKAAKLLPLNKFGKATGPDRFTLNRKDGTTSIVEVRTEVITIGGKKVVLGMVADITERKQAEEAWREAEEEKSALLEEAPVSIMHVDPKGKIIYVNKRFESESGYSREEIVGKNGFQLDWLTADTMKYLAKRMAARLNRRPAKHLETQFKRKDGQWIWVEITAKVLRRLGVPVGIQLVTRNVTARKQADEALQAEKNKLQSIVDAIEYGLTIQDRDYNIIYQNGSMIKAYGYHLGKKCYKTYEVKKKVCDGCPVEKAFKDGKPHTSERRVVLPSGETFFMENTANPIRDARGEVVSCLEIVRNITARKQAEEALRQSREELRKMFESVTDGIMVTDFKGVITKTNQRTADMHGFASKDELVGRNALELVAPRDRERMTNSMREALKQGTVRGVEHTLLKTDGSEFPAELSTSVLKDASGNAVAHITIVRDITERKQAEEKVQHLNRVLRAIRNINQLIARSTDRDSLLKGACDNFVETRGYYSAWIALLDESGKLVTVAESGLGESFLQVMEGLKHGELPHCGRKVLEKPGVFAMKDVSSECEGCPLVKEYAGRGAMSIRLEYGGKLYGLMTVSTPPGRVAEKEEHGLFEEIAEDIAFALHSMEQKQERKKAEEELSKTQTQLSSAVQMAHLGPWEYDAINDLFIFNDAFYEMFHTTAEEVGGYTMSSAEYARRFVHPEDAYLVGEEVRKALQADDPNFSSQLDHRIIYADGKVGYISVRFFIVKDETGRTVRAHGVNQDITERKQAEEALQTERNKLQSLIDAMEDTLTIQDTEYNIIYQNEPSKIASGGDHLGQKCYRVYEGRKSICEGCPVEKAFKDGKSHTAERKTTIAGKVAFWENTANPIRDAGGRIVSCLEVTRDITERKKQEQALADELTQRRLLIDKSLDGIVVLDVDARVVEANQRFAEMLGYTLEEVRELHTWDWDKNFTPEKLLEMGRNVDEKGLHLETKHTRKDGSVFDVDISISGIMCGGQKLIFCIDRDITERKQAAEALQIERNKLQSVINAMTDALTIQDREYNIIYQNEPSRKSTGGDRVGEKCYRVYEGRDKLCDGCPVEKAFKDGKPHTTERQRVLPSGKLSFWENTANPIRDAKGEVVSCLEIGRNITERRNQEQALADELTRRRLLVDQSLDGIVVLDENDKVYEANQRFAEMLGYTPEEIRELHTWDWEKNYSREQIHELGRKADEKGFLLETTHTRKDGSAIDVDISINAAMFGGQKLIFCACRDVTERKKAEQALADELTRRRLLIDQSLDGIVVLDVDAKVVEANQSFAEMLGYTLEEVRELHTWDWDKNFSRKKILEMGQNVDEKGLHVGTKHTRKDGSVIDVDISINGAMLGEQKLIFCVSRDITEHKRAEEALKLAAEEWRGTFDSIGDAISIHDRDFRILRANKAFADIFQMRPDQIIGRHCYELHKGGKPVSACPHKRTLATGKPAEAEFYESHLRKYLHESTSPIFDEKGEVVGTIHITRDITEQKQQNERLMMADRLASIGELAAGTAHELNNPLTSVLGFSQLVMEKDIPDDIREDLKLIYNEAQRAANVTKNLLTFGRKHAPMKQPTQINNIIEDVLKLRAYEHKINNIEVKRQLAPDLPEIMVDYFQMQQVFLNIIINAEYSMTEAHKRGTLTITTKKQNSTVMISITDDGPGIPRENLSRIFNPFFTTKEAGKGTGLGLSICHGIVSEHGGQIYARSQPGKGATIVIELPTNNH